MQPINDSWYESVSAESPITQGDLIMNCPVMQWMGDRLTVNDIDSVEVLQTSYGAFEVDVIVMTQACDLEQEKVANVILSPHIRLSEYQNFWKQEMAGRGQTPTNKSWGKFCKDVRDGHVWNLAILNNREDGPLVTEHRIVDFHEVYTLPRDFIESLLQQRGSDRLRLRPPYREHLSQAFARFFMRVGLPTPIADFW